MRKGSKSRRRPREKHNYQDAAEEREYRKGEEAGYNYGKRKAGNDVAWYATDNSILRDAASIPFSYAAGTRINTGFWYPQTAGSSDTSVFYYRQPGVMAYYIAPSVSYSESPNDPINVAATSMYSFVRHANSGAKNYNSPDLMEMVLAMSQVYSYINFLQRTYGLVSLYAQRNRNLPRAVLAASGVNYNDLSGKLADFRYGINVLINKAASIAVPSTLTVLQRHAFLYQNIYIEGESVRDAIYMMVPHGFWIYSETASEQGGKLTYTKLRQTSSLLTVQQLLQYGENMLAPIIGSEDFNIMSGDILKAYGDANLIKLSSLPEDYPIVPVYDKGVLEQLKNATVLPVDNWGIGLSSLDITQNQSNPTAPFLQFTPAIQRLTDDDTTAPFNDYGYKTMWSYIQEFMQRRQFLTTDNPDPTAETVVENSRLMITANPNYTPVGGGVALCTGTEMVVEANFVYADDDATQIVGSNFSSFMSAWQSTSWEGNWAYLSTAMSWPRLIAILNALSNFDFTPQIYTFVQPTQNGYPTTYQTGSHFDLDNYTIIGPESLYRLHEACLLNEFHVPIVGKL